MNPVTQKEPGPNTGNMDARKMRHHNSQRVLRIVRKMGPISRADVTRSTRLSPPTVSSLINDLLMAGLLEEQGEGISSGGRKPQLVSFNAMCGVVLGANIGSGAVQLAVADMNGNVVAQDQVELGSDTRPKPLLRQIASSARGLLRGIVSERTPLLAAAVGAPGMTDISMGVVLEAANLDDWTNVPARQLLEKDLGVPVIVENDVNLAAIGEHWRGRARGVHNFVFISIDTGIGAGIVIDDRIHRGHRWHAGEISHLNVDFREWDTDFGAAGYLESYLGGPPKARAQRAPRRTGGAFDQAALLRLGAAVANIATVIDPASIVFGGRIALKAVDLLEHVREVAASIAPNCPPFFLTELGEDASLHGSIRVALDQANEALHNLFIDRPTAAA
jgi:glucokinase